MYLPPKVDGELNEIRLIKHLMLRLAQSDQTFSLSLLSTSKIDIDFFIKVFFIKVLGSPMCLSELFASVSLTNYLNPNHSLNLAQ